MKIRSLHDLGSVQKQIAEARALQAARDAARAEAERLDRLGKELFIRTVGRVKPISDGHRALLTQEQPAPVAVHRQRDEAAALREALSDDFDAGTLLDTDEHLSYRRPGIGPDVTRKLRRGDWRIQRDIDLHGLRTEAAREALGAFIREAHQQGLRCVRVVHGKGLGSPGKTPVLKSRVHGWLIQKNEVLAFVQARPAQGGAGALVVLLKPSSAAKV
ncbi:MAG: Smr/MutS family protein [Rhodoferax sp.]